MTENKKTIRTIIIVVLMCILVLGYYAYLSDKNARKQQAEQLTEKDELLLYDLDKDYPYAPTDVVKLYSRMISCVYNERLEGKDLKEMVAQMRRLYADEFANESGNAEENQIANLEKELSGYGDKDHKFTNYTIAEMSQIEYGEVDGKKTALVDAVYTIRLDNEYSKESQVYVLIQDKDENWKILGWQGNATQNLENTSKEKE